jgi:nucleoporin POM34
MATPASTPLSKLPSAPTPPGEWHHPRLAEINQRKQAASFDDSKLRIIIYSSILLFLSFLLPSYIHLSRMLVSSLSPLLKLYANVISRFQLSSSYQLAATWTLRFFRLTVAFNGLNALRPLLPIGPKDDLSDIPLTPRQRTLLGLSPLATPPTPGSTYITPPRYVRSTPRAVSASSSRAATVGSSPFGRSVSGSPVTGSPLRSGGSFSGSFSGSPANGLVRRATVAGNKRWSLGSGSGVVGLEDSVFGSAPSTPTPSGGQRGVSVALNNKWLYKRQHGSPSGSTKYI